MTFKSQVPGTTGDSSGKSQRRLDCRRSIKTKSHELGAWHEPLDCLRKVDFFKVLTCVELPASRRDRHRRQNLGTAMPQHKWSLAQREVQIGIAVNIRDPVSQRTCIEHGVRIAKLPELA
jgi:hypothetical protein